MRDGIAGQAGADENARLTVLTWGNVHANLPKLGRFRSAWRPKLHVAGQSQDSSNNGVRRA
jgi:hypothetical protein